MNDELKAKLLAALRTAGLPEGLLANLNITEEGEIQGVIDNLTGISTPPQPLTREELEKNPIVKSIADARVTQALKKKKPDTPPATPPNNEPTLAEQIAAAITEANKPLLEEISGLKSERTLEQKQKSASELINSSKLSDFNKKIALSRLDFSSETGIQDQITALETEETNYLQSLADSGKLASAPPALGGTGELSDADAQAIADRQKI